MTQSKLVNTCSSNLPAAGCSAPLRLPSQNAHVRITFKPRARALSWVCEGRQDWMMQKLS